MAIDQDLIEAVKSHADIVDIISAYLTVTKKGRQYVAICPFHDDTDPSLQISKEKQIFHCFVCQKGGDCITFVKLHDHCSYFEAMQKVAELSHFKDPRLEKKSNNVVVEDKLLPLKKCMKDLTDYYEYALNTDEGKDGSDYLDTRHLDDRMRAKYHLGYAFKDGASTIRYLEKKGHSLKTIELCGIANPTNGVYIDHNQGRAIFPIQDINGDFIGYSARRLVDDNSPKYVNSKEGELFEKRKVLYNINNARDEAKHRQYIYILEGFMDVFALDRIGEHSAVALMGTAFTDEHIKIFKQLNVELRFCLDGDEAGQKAMMTIMDKLKNSGLQYSFVDNCGSLKDPDEILNEDGEEALKNYISNLLSPFDFAMKFYSRTKPLTTMEDRKKLVTYFLPFLSSIRSDLELNDYIIKLSKTTKFDTSIIKEMVIKTKKTSGSDYKKVLASFHPERKALRKLQLAERALLYQMVNDKEAIKFYEDKIGDFYDTIYRQIANYIIELASKHDEFDISDIISFISSSENPESEELITELTNISFEKNHPNCSTEYLSEIVDTIIKEKKKKYEDDVLQRSLEGKTELEKARILADYNRRKMVLKEEEKDGKKD